MPETPDVEDIKWSSSLLKLLKMRFDKIEINAGFNDLEAGNKHILIFR